MTTIDRTSLARGKEPLATLATFRKGAHGALNFGVHLCPCSGLQPDNADVLVGQEIHVLEYHERRHAEWSKSD